MATDLPISFRASPLPSNFRGSPQQLLDAMVARLAVVTEDQLALFVNGTTAPTSDSGPFIKNGQTWWVWDTGTGAYIPQVIDFQSLRYNASLANLDQTKYVFQIRLDGAGKAQSIDYYSGGAWKDVYQDTLAAIAAANKAYPWRGDSSGDQAILFAAPGNQSVEVALVETFDPDNVFIPNAFTAPTDGWYQIDAKVHLTATGTPTGNTVHIQLTKNSFGLANEITFFPIVDGNTGDCTYPISSLIQLSAGDVLTLIVEINITGGTGADTWTIKQDNTFFAGHRVQAA